MGLAKLFLSFEGRIGRLQFWLGNIVVVVVYEVLDWLLGIPLTSDPTTFRDRLIDFVIGVVSLYPTAAIGVKRLHDRNEPGTMIWLFVAAFAVSLVGDLFGFFDINKPDTLWNGLAAGFVFVVVLAYLIYLGFRSGDASGNDYGPPP